MNNDQQKTNPANILNLGKDAPVPPLKDEDPPVSGSVISSSPPGGLSVPPPKIETDKMSQEPILNLQPVDSKQGSAVGSSSPISTIGSVKSSIRTMESDLKNFSAGKVLEGQSIDLKKEFIPVPKPNDTKLNVGDTSQKPVVPSTPTSAGSIFRPTVPASSNGDKIKGVSMGKSVPAKSLETDPKYKDLVSPKSSSLNVPTQKPKLRILTPFIVVFAILVGGAAVWYFGFRDTAENVTSPSSSPSESLTPTLTPVPVSVADLFKNPVHIEAGSKNTVANLQAVSLGLKNKDLEFNKLNGFSVGGNATISYNFDDFSKSVDLNIPDNILENLNLGKWALFSFGQEEIIKNGVSTKSTTPFLRKGFVVEAKNQSNLQSSLNLWENNIAKDLEVFLGIDSKKQFTTEFLTSNFGNNTIRFKNFPNPDLSLDYSVVQKNGTIFWIVTNSRQSISEVLKQLDLLASGQK